MRRAALTRAAFVLVAVAAVGAASLMFYVGDEVRVLRQRLDATEARIAQDREALRVSATEWSYFNRPAKLAGLARRHLALAPMGAQRIIRFEDLPPRRATPEGTAP